MPNVLRTGSFVGAGDGIHNAEGIAKIIPLQDGSSILRLENLRVTNGPDLYVYLSPDESASDFINIGKLKANNGNQNYEIPKETDLSKYDTVLIWCRPFSVLFGSAELIGRNIARQTSPIIYCLLYSNIQTNKTRTRTCSL